MTSLFYDLGHHPSEFKSMNELPKVPCRKRDRSLFCDKDVYRRWKNQQKEEEEIKKQYGDIDDDETVDSEDTEDDYLSMTDRLLDNTNYTLTRDLTKNRIDIKPSTTQSRPDNVFFSTIIRALVVGGTGCGKTTYLLHIINNHVRYGLDFNIVIVYAPIESLLRGLLSEFVRKNKEEESGYKVLSYDVNDCYDPSFLTFDDVCKMVQYNPEVKPLVIYDDCVMAMAHKKQVRQDFNNYLNQGTRCNLVALFNLIQDYSSIPPYLRNSFTVMILFPKRLARSQFKALVDNCVNSIAQKNNELFNFLMQLITNSTNQHLSLLVCSEADSDKQLRLDDCYITRNWSNEYKNLVKNKLTTDKSKGGRPLGRKDSVKRKRRTKRELELTKNNNESN